MTKISTKNKISRFLSMLLTVLVITLIYSAVDDYSCYKYVYTSGQLTAHGFRNVFQNLSVFFILYFVYRNLKWNNKILNFTLLLTTILLISITYAAIDSSTFYGSAFKSGYSAKHIFTIILKTVGIFYLFILTFSKNKSNLFEPLY